MASVTQRINEIRQPVGGFLNPLSFALTQLNKETELNPDENIHNDLVGLAVEYLARYMTGTPKEEVFKISLQGAEIIKEADHATELLAGIAGLDDGSIRNACKLSGYDVCYRTEGIGYKPVQFIEPDPDTIFNIRTMVERSLKFIQIYGPTIKDGFSFEGGYTNKVSSGDGDFLTETTLWDFKLSRKPLTKEYTLELLMHFLMGIHTKQKEFRAIKSLGLYNPRLNAVYMIETKRISQDTKERVSLGVIGY